MESSTRAKSFRDRLQQEIIVFDGGMGTSLYDKGIFINTCFDELNLMNPDLVRDVHREYVAAGADVIETNTFGANRYKLAPYGLEKRVHEVNLAGARIAVAAAADRRWWPARWARWECRSSRWGRFP